MISEGFSIEWTAVGAGIVSFLIAYSFDWAALKRIASLKQMIAVAMFILHGYALYAVCWGITRFALPVPLLWIGWVLLPLSLLLLFYSFFIEIPFTKTYAKKGSSNQLVTTGTYALVRHPGVIWYCLLLLSLFFVTGSMTLLVAAPIWIIMDLIYVVIQERFFFGNLFPGYPDYQKQTPMLMPTRQSIVKCIKTLKTKEVLE